MTSRRRWAPGQVVNAEGVFLRVMKGDKSPDDLRMDIRLGGEWVAVRMSLAFALVDFFAENERHLQPVNPHWRVNGDTYFMRECVNAMKNGYDAPTSKIRRQRVEKWS